MSEVRNTVYLNITIVIRKKEKKGGGYQQNGESVTWVKNTYIGGFLILWHSYRSIINGGTKRERPPQNKKKKKKAKE
jgi:hypothetical protein